MDPCRSFSNSFRHFALKDDLENSLVDEHEVKGNPWNPEKRDQEEGLESHIERTRSPARDGVGYGRENRDHESERTIAPHETVNLSSTFGHELLEPSAVSHKTTDSKAYASSDDTPTTGKGNDGPKIHPTSHG